MSHTTKMTSVPIRDTAALQALTDELNANGVRCRLSQNKAPRMYRRDQFRLDAGQETAEYCLELLDGQYDVGFVKSKTDDTYEIIFDSWANNVHKFLGAKAGQHKHGGLNGTQGDLGYMLQLYTKHAAINAATANGQYVESCEVDEKTGQIHMTLAEY